MKQKKGIETLIKWRTIDELPNVTPDIQAVII